MFEYFSTSEGYKLFIKIAKIGLLTLGCSMILCFLVLIGFQIYFKDRVIQNVTMSGVGISGLNAKELRTQIEKENIDLVTKNIKLGTTTDKSYETTADKIGISIATEKTVAKCLSVGRSPNYFIELYNTAQLLIYKKEVSPIISIQQDKFAQFIEEASKSLNIDPTDASITIIDGEIVEIAPANGYKVNSSNLPQQIVNSIVQNKEEIEVEIDTVEPTIGLAGIVEAKNNALRIVNLDLVLDYEKTNIRPSKQTKGSWVKIENTNNAVTALLDQNKVLEYVNSLKNQINVAKIDRQVDSVTNQVIREGRAGRSLNADKTVASIVNALDKGISKATIVAETVNPAEIKYCSQYGVETGRYAGKYLDADLSTQRMCMINGYDLIGCMKMSSGASESPTPAGSFSIYQKLRQNISPLVILNWWQRFAPNGYGIHEIPMTPEGVSVGANRLGSKASHGCLRLNIGDAETVYNWTELGTNVYIHN